MVPQQKSQIEEERECVSERGRVRERESASLSFISTFFSLISKAHIISLVGVGEGSNQPTNPSTISLLLKEMVVPFFKNLTTLVCQQK